MNNEAVHIISCFIFDEFLILLLLRYNDNRIQTLTKRETHTRLTELHISTIYVKHGATKLKRRFFPFIQTKDFLIAAVKF